MAEIQEEPDREEDSKFQRKFYFFYITWQSKAQLQEATKNNFGNDNFHMIDPPCCCGRRSGPVNSASQFLPVVPQATHVPILNKREKQFKTPTKAKSLLQADK